MDRRLTVASFHTYTADVYSFRFEGYSSWAIFTVCNATGELSIQSDWGDWSYRWNIDALGKTAKGDNIRLTQFLSDRSSYDYVATKLFPQPRAPSRELTLRALQEEIIRCRREKDIDKYSARGFWDEARVFARNCFDLSIETAVERLSGDFYEFLGEPWEFVRDDYKPDYLLLRDQLLPIFVDALQDSQ